MATSGFAPPSLSWSSTNLPEAYRSFRQYTTLIFDGPFANKTEKEKVTYLLIWIGSHGRDIYEGWTWNSPDDKFKLKLVLDKFQQHIEPQVNSYLARYNFHKSRQTADESVDEFVARLRVLAAKCKFADVGETHVRLIEQIIVGTKHVAVQEKLLEKGDSLSSLDAALDIARTYEATKSHVAQLQSTSSSTVHGVQKQQSSASASTNCTRCGLDHSTTATCPAKGATCLNCGKPNHWAQVCKAKRGARGRAPAKSQRARQRESSKPRAKPRQRSHQSRVDELTDDLECLVFQSVDEHGETTDDRSQAFVTLQLDIIRRHRSTALKAKIDTGAQANVLPLRVYRRMFPDQLTAEGLPRKDQLKPSTTKLVSYGGTQLRQYGVCTLKCTFDDMTLSTDFFVTDADGPTILGLPSLEKFGIITVNCEIATEASEPPPDSSLPKINGTADLLRLYPECFRGVGKFEGTYHITTDPDVPPVIHAPGVFRSP